MTIQELETGSNEYFAFAELATDKAAAFVAAYHSGYKAGHVTVICKNSSHKAWRKFGRDFDSWEAAEAGYKSPAMKSMIQHAREMLSAVPA